MGRYTVSINGQVHIPFDIMEEADEYLDAIQKAAKRRGIDIDVWIHEEADDGTPTRTTD